MLQEKSVEEKRLGVLFELSMVLAKLALEIPVVRISSSLCFHFPPVCIYRNELVWS